MFQIIFASRGKVIAEAQHEEEIVFLEIGNEAIDPDQ